MSLNLQILHVVLFATLWVSPKSDRRAAFWLAMSGLFYIVAQRYIWPHYYQWPDGILIHLFKIAIDYTVIYLIHKSWTKFALLQSFILFLMIGLNVLAAVEFPFLAKVDIVYDAYANSSHILNVFQLIVGTGYGLYIIGLVDYCRDLYYRMDTGGTVNASTGVVQRQSEAIIYRKKR